MNKRYGKHRKNEHFLNGNARDMVQGVTTCRVNRAFTCRVNRAFTRRVNRAFTHQVNRAFTHRVDRAFTHQVNRVFTLRVNRAFTCPLNGYRQETTMILRAKWGFITRLFTKAKLFDEKNEEIRGL